MWYPSVLVHLFSAALYVQDHVSVSAAAEYTPTFCIWLTGATPDCTPSSVIVGAYVQNSVRVSTLILAKKKKGHKTHTQVFTPLKYCEWMEYSSLVLSVCAQSNNHFAGSSHSHSVTQSDVCAFSMLPIHSVICLSPGFTTCGNRTVHEPPHNFTGCWAQTGDTGRFRFRSWVQHYQVVLILWTIKEVGLFRTPSTCRFWFVLTLQSILKIRSRSTDLTMLNNQSLP